MSTHHPHLHLVGETDDKPWYEQLGKQWRAEAAILRHRGASPQAEVLESCASDMVQRGDEWDLETLTLKQAEKESGLSYSGLEKMVRDGRIENAGREGSPRVRRGDLPRKTRHPSPRQAQRGEPNLADSVLSARAG